jgi:hypothetical protein
MRMNKITAVSMLMNGECDSIMHGTSEFILLGEDVVNKRSKKALDMKKMREEGWDTKLLPRWDDAFADGAERPTLCFLENDGSLIIILSKTEDGDYITSYGEIFDKDVYGELRPATREEALSLLADVQGAPASKPKSKATRKPEPEGDVIPAPKETKAQVDEMETAEDTACEECIDLDGDMEQPDTVEPEGTVDADEGVDEAVDMTTPFDLDEDTAIPTDAPAPEVKQEACQTKKSTTTAVPKEEDDSLSLRDQYVALGLKKELWGDFCSYCFNNKIDNKDRMSAGNKYASTLVIDYAAHRAKTEQSVPSKHDPDNVIVDKLEVLVDFGLEQDDALAFYNFHKLDKFRLARLISDATDGRLTEMVTQFYDNVGS